jgi:hypothetical protein
MGGTKKLNPDKALIIAHVAERPKNSFMNDTAASTARNWRRKVRNGKKVRKVSKV